MDPIKEVDVSIGTNQGNSLHLAKRQAVLERLKKAAAPHTFAVAVLLVWAIVGIVGLVTGIVVPGEVQFEQH